MPTLTVNGRDVQIDDGFFKLSPDQQNATVDEIAKNMSMGPQQSGSALGDAARFVGTAAVRGLGGLADFATDPLSPIRRIIDPRLEHMEQSVRPHPGQAAGDLAFAATGVPEYQPTTLGERVGMATAQGAVAGGPFGIGGALLGAAGGLLGQSTQEATGSERAATVAGLLPSILTPAARGTVNAVTGKARETIGPSLSQSYRQGLAGDQLRNAATDPEGLKSALNIDQVGPINQGLVPGSSPTLFQLTGDMGIGQLERGARTRDAAPFLDRAAEQNAARVSQVGAMAPENAASSAVRDLLRQRLDAIDAQGDASLQGATQNAQQAFARAGGLLDPNLYGGLMREQMEAAKGSAKADEARLWQAIDPNGTLTIGGSPVRREAARIASEVPQLAKPAAGEEAAIFDAARSLPEVLRFNEFAALRGRLLQAIRDERPNGQTPALRRMQMLRSAMDETISGAAEQAAQTDAGLIGRINAHADELTGTGEQARAVAGGYDNPGTAAVPAGNAPSVAGRVGTAGDSAFGLGNASGRAGVSRPPPKPQDIVEFLISRGGVRDDGGELRAMDTNRVNGGYGTGGVGTGQFGVLSRKNGLPPDTAREYAAEAGYLSPESTISDLFDAIHDSTRGLPHYSERDADIVANWDHYARTGEAPPSHSGPVFGMTDLPPNFDQGAAQRYRAAANATRDRAQTFNNNIVGPTLQEAGGGGYRMFDSRVPERFISSPEGVQAFLSAGGDAGTLRDALAADLRRSASGPDGTLNPQKFATWQTRRAAALQAFPDLRDTLSNAARAQEAVDAASATARQNTLDFQKGAARHFLNAEPDKAVQSALASKNPVADFRELTRLVSGDADARAGLQRAIADHLARNYVGNTEAGTSGIGTMKSDAFQTMLRRNGMALAQIFSPQQMRGMEAVAADLQRSNRSIASSKIPGQSNTAQDLALTGGRASLLRQHLGDAALGGAGGLAGLLLSGGPGGALIGMQAGVAKAALGRMKAAGIEQTNQLVTEALLNPELARTLLITPNPANRPMIAASLKSALGRIAAAEAARDAQRDHKTR